jgi:hypothetical protein
MRENVNKVLTTDFMRFAFLQPFEDYCNFIGQYTDYKKPHIVYDFAYSMVHTYKKDMKNISIICLNSAWLSARNKDIFSEFNDYGYLAIGEPQIDDALRETTGADLRITVLHHPVAWLVEHDANVVEGRLTKNSHFILHGHQHMPKLSVMDSTLGDVAVIPAGATFSSRYSADPRYISSYNFVTVNLDSGQGTIFFRRWHDQGHSWDADKLLWHEGRFEFNVPKLGKPADPRKKYVINAFVARHNKRIEKRFFEDLHINVTHELAKNLNNSGVDLLKVTVLFKGWLAEGEPEDFLVTLEPGPRVKRIVEKHKLDIAEVNVEYFKTDDREKYKVEEVGQKKTFDSIERFPARKPR